MTRILDKRNPEEVSDLQLAAHASDFVLGGSETTATTLSCIVYYLLKNPDIMVKLQNEIRTRYRLYAEINSSSAQNLPYLKAVILEGLRIFPPVPFSLPRVVPQGGAEVDGCFLPAGVSTLLSPRRRRRSWANTYIYYEYQTIVGTNPVAATLSPRNFREPLKFDPERWLCSKEKDPQNNLSASQPFSLGSRGCIGIK